MITFGTKAGITPFQFIKTVVIFLLGSCALLACKSQPEASSSPVLLTNAEQVANYDSLLFRAEDLGWPKASYYLRNESIVLIGTPIYTVTADAMAYSNPINPKTGLRYRDEPSSAGQVLSVYNDEKEAASLFEKEFKLYGLPLGSYEPEEIQFKPKVDNILWGCWNIGGSTTMNCNIYMQHGRLLTTASMGIDREEVTFADFEVFINVIQDRLLEQVASEP